MKLKVLLNIKWYKFPGTNLISAEMVQAIGMESYSENQISYIAV